MINRRQLLTGASMLAAERALAQPTGNAGWRDPPWGPSQTANAGGGPPGPSLSLDFMTPGTLDPRVTFARASSATYIDSAGVMRTATANTPRWDYDPATHALNGLLIEEARTNDIFPATADPGWGLINTTEVPALLAGVPRWKVTTQAGGGNYGAFVNLPCPVGKTTVASVWVWIPASYSTSDGPPKIDMDTGGLGTGGSVAVYPADMSKRDQWQRITSTITVGTGGNALYNFVGRVSVVTGGGNVFYWTCFQSEQNGVFPTSYIQAGGAATTRAVDAPSFPFGSWYAAPGGSWFAEFIHFNNTSGFFRIIGYPSGSTQIFLSPDSRAIAQYDGLIATSTDANVYPNTLIRAISTMAVPNGKLCSNGGLVTTITGHTNGYPTGLPLILFTNNVPSESSSGYMRGVQYWPRVLSNGEMIARTQLPGPVLTLDFMTPGTLNPRVNYTRATTATYVDATGVVRTAAVNAPRWDYKNGVLQGLMIEEPRTNLLLQSADFASVSWSKDSNGPGVPVVTANQVTAPDGTLTADRVDQPAVSAAGTLSLLNQSFTTTAQVYTFTMWLRGNVGGEQTYLCVSGGGVFWSAPRITLTTQWQRYTFVTPSLPAATIFFALGTDVRDPAQSSTPAQTVYAWGSQCEPATFPTSYIATTNATVSRARDITSIFPTADWYVPFGGSWVAEFICNNTPTAGKALRVVHNSMTGDPAQMYIDGNNSNAIGQYDGSAAFVSPTGTTVGAISKGGTTWARGRATACANGGGVASSTVFFNGYPPDLGNLGIMFLISFNLNDSMTGYLRLVQYWGRSVTDLELQRATT